MASSRPQRSNKGNIEYVEIDSAVDFPDDDEDEEQPVVNINKGIRIAICVLLEKHFQGVLSMDAVEAIRRRLLLGKRHGIKNVISDYLLHQAMGIPYKGDRIQREPLGRKLILDMDSVEASLLADKIEDGVSLPTCWDIINEHRQQEQKPSVTYSAVYGLLQHMQPKQQLVKVHRQGNADVELPGAKARHGWATQLLVRYGELDFTKE